MMISVIATLLALFSITLYYNLKFNRLARRPVELTYDFRYAGQGLPKVGDTGEVCDIVQVKEDTFMYRIEWKGTKITSNALGYAGKPLKLLMQPTSFKYK